MNHSLRRPASQRRGAIVVLAGILCVVFLGMVAFAVDVGYLALVKTELQNAADSAAIAGASGLIDAPSQAKTQAETFGENNYAASRDVNIVPAEDVDIGIWNYGTRTFSPVSGAALAQANAVRVTTLVSNSRGNAAGLFFSRIFGHNSADLNAQATAALWSDLRGFRIPPNGQNLPLLPLAMDLQTWQDAMAGTGPDGWTWNDTTNQVDVGSDGKVEVNLYPDGGTGASGNRGLIDIGGHGGDVPTLRDQILNGINSADLNHHGGSLELNSQGQMPLSGETGVRQTLRSELSAIVGETRIIPLFDHLTGSGTNASYRIVRFAGVRIMDVDMAGNPKTIMAQPTYVYVHGGIPDTSGSSSSSDTIFSAPGLVN
ncbi:MAG: pilus assembly protein TadG-related protein [Planctomycetota bacterium]|nr:pilus assembly protein TadG-related protein [Planctomycetota bacterium]